MGHCLQYVRQTANTCQCWPLSVRVTVEDLTTEQAGTVRARLGAIIIGAIIWLIRLREYALHLCLRGGRGIISYIVYRSQHVKN